MSAKVGEEKAATLILALQRYFPFPLIGDFLIGSFLQFMGSKLIGKLPAELIAKLETKLQTHIEVIGCTEKEVGSILVSTITELKKTAKEKKDIEESGKINSNTSISSNKNDAKDYTAKTEIDLVREERVSEQRELHILDSNSVVIS